MSYRGILFATFLCLLSIWVVEGHFCGDDNCFELLKVTKKATKAQIRRSYRKLSQTMHPDKRVGVANAAEEFAKIASAYETLLDDDKRAKYIDFLENPLKYPEYVKPKYYYYPKTNGAVVFMILIGVFSIGHWFHMNSIYKNQEEKARNSMEFRRQVSKLVKEKLAKNKEVAAEMINIDIGPKPNWKQLFIVRLAYVPLNLASYLKWSLLWFVKYKIFKKEKSDDDKLYLVRKNMQMSPTEWENVSEEEKKTFLEKGLEDLDECNEYLRLKRIELNKAGKLKKKKKHTPLPYSEVEDINM